jgi:hypothetical protein
MEKYRHKITGKVVIIQELGCQAIKGAKWGDWEIPFWVIENSNDWELVVEKDYEILSFRNRENNLLYTLYDGRYKTQNIDGFTDLGDRDLQYCMKYYEIRSIKRLSDNEIFTLRDNITYNESCSVKIISLECENHTILININNGGFYFLKDAEKVKPCLFTTLDGVEIFKGDTYWYVNTNTFDVLSYKADKMIMPNLPFSTEIAAKNYKAENGKKYSLIDVKKALNCCRPQTPTGYTHTSNFLQRLKNGN